MSDWEDDLPRAHKSGDGLDITSTFNKLHEEYVTLTDKHIEYSDNIENELENTDELSKTKASEIQSAVDQSLETIIEIFESLKQLQPESPLINDWKQRIEKLEQERVRIARIIRAKLDACQENHEQNKLDEEVEKQRALLQKLIEKAEAQRKQNTISIEASKAAVSKQKQTHNSSSTPLHTNQPQASYITPSSSPVLSRQVSKSSPQSLPANSSSVFIDGDSLAKSLAEAISLSRMPALDLSVFTGDPLHFADWRVAFEALIESRPCNPLEKLHYLKKYVGGAAAKAISGYFYLQSHDAYDKAKAILTKRFGDSYIVAEAFRHKLDKWPKIASRDGSGLQAYSDFLQQCLAAMSSISDLAILDDIHENRKMLGKLPDHIVNRWVRQVREHKIRNAGKCPKFSDFCIFIMNESEIANDSLLAPNHHTSDSHGNFSHKNKEKRVALVTGSNVTSTRSQCLFCKRSNHATTECFKLGKLEQSKKEEFVKANRLCYSCLNTGHMSKECNKKATCSKCQKIHATALHREHRPANANASVPPKTEQAGAVGANSNVLKPQQANNEQHVSHNSVTKAAASSVTSMALPVWISTTSNPQETLMYALLDPQSNTSFVTQSAVGALGAVANKTTLNLTTMTSSSAQMNCGKVMGLRVRGYNSNITIDLPPVYTVDDIPAIREHLPTAENVKMWPHLAHIADEMIQRRSDLDVGLLIGYTCPQAFLPRQCVTGNDQEPFAVRTDLGWVVMGGPNATSDTKSISHRIHSEEIMLPHDPERNSVTFKVKAKREKEHIVSHDILRALQSDFNESGKTASNESLSVEDRMFLNMMNEGISHDEQGYITMPLPLKAKPPRVNTKAAATHRFNLLVKKFNHDPQYAKQYAEFMTKIIGHGDAEVVPANELENPDTWYIPHFGVYHPKKPTKIRVVFDCSAKVGGFCLNDFLLQGPDHMNSLIGILMRFRKEPVAVMCDVERMFHQFRVTPQCQDYLRFLWFGEDGDIVTYRMRVHLFGAKSSPACATFGLRYLAQNCGGKDDVGNIEAVRFIHDEFYVDDGLISVSNTDKARDLIQTATALCAVGNVRLHKFISNDIELMSTIPTSERAESIVDLALTADAPLPTERALGIHWDVQVDSFKFQTNNSNKPMTRRGVLSTVASVYDPLGFLAPFTVVGKMILQEMCKEKLGWDEPLTYELENKWFKWQKDLDNLVNINIPRCYKPHNFGTIVQAELHSFSDASTTAYGQCTYLRLVDDGGKVHVSLVMAKSRVAPLKAVTIPRLELQAAVVSAEISQLVANQLNIEQLQHHFWTDSKVVLGYISNASRRFQTYVANRVQKIHDITEVDQWHYISTSENPADHASRGLTIQQLIASNWIKGPAFLWQHPSVLPPQSLPPLDPNDPEVKAISNVINQKPGLLQDIERFSNWNRAVSVVARLQSLFRSKQNQAADHVSAFQAAQNVLIKAAQQASYGKEIEQLCNNQSVAINSPLAKLAPFIDEVGLLRVGGRLGLCTSLSEEEKHPVLLPSNTHVSLLIVRHYHNKVAHQGKGITAAAIRTAGFWLVGGGRAIAKCIHQCVVCKKLRGKPQTQQMAPLPTDRLETVPPFTYCGCDCFGPFLVKERRKELKRYGLIFTCMSSRAVHLEVLDDLTTDAFLNALRTIIAIRGPIRQIRCDNGTNFAGAVAELSKQDQTLHTMHINFVFNPPSSSHMGGVWERQIRTVRSVLKSLTTKYGGRFDTSTLRTIFYEVMAIVNSRPLTAVNDENSPLTPNMLLTMKSDIVLPPPGDFQQPDIYARKRWRQVQQVANEFWHKWRTEYIHHLQQRQKWLNKIPDVAVGDIVLLHDQQQFRNNYNLCKVIECMKSADGLIRKVKLQVGDRNYRPNNVTQATTLERPIHKLVVLLRADNS